MGNKFNQKNEKSEEELRKMIKTNPGNIDAHINLGTLLYNLKRYNEAEEDYRKAIKIDSKNAEAHYGLGVSLYNLKRYEEAEKELIKAIEINPEFAEAHSWLGFLFKELNRYEEAEEEYRKAIKINSKDANTHNCLGFLLYDLERYEEAEEEYRKAIELNPGHVNAHNNLGLLLLDTLKYKESEKELRKAIELNPDHVNAHNNLGLLLHNLQRYEEAEDEYRKAIKLCPGYALPRNNLGNLLYNLKRYEEGAREYKKAREIEHLYLFNWNDVPGNDSAQVLNHLCDDLKIYWVKNAKIKKRSNGKTIIVTNGENSLRFKINEEEHKVILEIRNEKTYEYILKEENGMLNIYDPLKYILDGFKGSVLEGGFGYWHEGGDKAVPSATLKEIRSLNETHIRESIDEFIKLSYHGNPKIKAVSFYFIRGIADKLDGNGLKKARNRAVELLCSTNKHVRGSSARALPNIVKNLSEKEKSKTFYSLMKTFAIQSGYDIKSSVLFSAGKIAEYLNEKDSKTLTDQLIKIFDEEPDDKIKSSAAYAFMRISHKIEKKELNNLFYNLLELTKSRNHDITASILYSLGKIYMNLGKDRQSVAFGWMMDALNKDHPKIISHTVGGLCRANLDEKRREKFIKKLSLMIDKDKSNIPPIVDGLSGLLTVDKSYEKFVIGVVKKIVKERKNRNKKEFIKTIWKKWTDESNEDILPILYHLFSDSDIRLNKKEKKLQKLEKRLGFSRVVSPSTDDWVKKIKFKKQ